MILDLLELLGSIGIEVLRPGEDRAGGYFVEANVGQCLEELVPIDEPCSLLLDKGGVPLGGVMLLLCVKGGEVLVVTVCELE